VKLNRCLFPGEGVKETASSKMLSEDIALVNVVFESERNIRKLDGFGRCPSLCRIVIPPTVEVISWSSFHQCNLLRAVIFERPSRLSCIDEFYDCSVLSEIYLPSSVRVISENAFLNRTSLARLIFDMPSSNQMGDGFSSCASLSRVELHVFVGLHPFIGLQSHF
jgi:hypothetical protein